MRMPILVVDRRPLRGRSGRRGRRTRWQKARGAVRATRREREGGRPTLLQPVDL
jgi:hypothetical protein